MKKLTTQYILPLLAALSLLAFTGCENNDGIGEEVEEAGEAVEDAAEEADN